MYEIINYISIILPLLLSLLGLNSYELRGGPASRKRPLPGADDGVLALLSDRAPAMQLLPGANLHSGMLDVNRQ